MKILGIDTCTETIDVALTTEGRTLSGKRGRAPRQQLTKLMSFISDILDESGVAIKDLDLISVTTGPGSFTGIRLGIATAKTIAQINAIPLASVNTIDAVAATCPYNGRLVAALDARKGEVFFGEYQKDGNEIMSITGRKRATVNEFIQFIRSYPQDSVLTGSVLWRYGVTVREAAGERFNIPDEKFWTPSGEKVAILGSKIAGKNGLLDYNRLMADYMRDFVAKPPSPLI